MKQHFHSRCIVVPLEEGQKGKLLQACVKYGLPSRTLDPDFDVEAVWKTVLMIPYSIWETSEKEHSDGPPAKKVCFDQNHNQNQNQDHDHEIPPFTRVEAEFYRHLQDYRQHHPDEKILLLGFPILRPILKRMAGEDPNMIVCTDLRQLSKHRDIKRLHLLGVPALNPEQFLEKVRFREGVTAITVLPKDSLDVYLWNRLQEANRLFEYPLLHSARQEVDKYSLTKLQARMLFILSLSSDAIIERGGSE